MPRQTRLMKFLFVAHAGREGNTRTNALFFSYTKWTPSNPKKGTGDARRLRYLPSDNGLVNDMESQDLQKSPT